jgi:DNA-binding SARP family transcriptional activator
MEFGVLGPLLVRDETGVLAVRAAKQRTLMAVLLLNAGRVVSVDRLVETLWDGTPPVSAVPSLRNYVLRLRACLGAAGSRVGFRDGGYVIEVHEDEVDLQRFAGLREEGTAAFDRGHYTLAGRLLARALQQWRGPALVDVTSDALHREERPHLAESRLDVMELRLEAEFRAVGRVPWSAELRDLARAHPERERLWEHLITSLHGNGRRTEALAEYRRMERTLAQEYGVRPGERLRALHGRIRGAGAEGGDAGAGGGAGAEGRAGTEGRAGIEERAARSVVGGAAVPVTGQSAAAISPSVTGPIAVVEEPAPFGVLAGVVPFQIPAAPPDLTGRECETAQLVARLTGEAAGNGAPTVVSGQPGIGKTALALHAVHAVHTAPMAHGAPATADGAFPGGVLYADLRASSGNPARPADVLASFLKAHGVPARRMPSGLDDRAALLRSLLARRRTLLVLDDAADCGQVSPLLPGPGAGAALITSRTRLDELCGVAHIEPGALSADASARLLGAIAGRARVAAEPRPAADLVRACEGLPLALRVAGTRLAARPGRSVRWLADRLTAQQPGTLFDELSVGTLNVRDGLTGVYRALTPDQARAFRILTAQAGPAGVAVSGAAQLLGVDPRRAEQLLEQLVDRYLLACGRQTDHYVFRPLTHAYGRELMARAAPDQGGAAYCRATSIIGGTGTPSTLQSRPNAIAEH